MRYPLLQRSMIFLRTPPGIRTRSHSLRRRPRCPVALAASGASRRGRTRALPLKRRRCCHYTREAWGRRGLNPHGPLPFPLVISPRGYAPVDAPRDRTWRYRCIRAAPSTSWVVLEARKMEVSSPTVSPVARVQAPLRRRPRIFQGGERRERSPARERRSAFEAVPAPRGFALRDCSPARCEQAGDGGRRRTRIPALSRPPGFRPGPVA